MKALLAIAILTLTFTVGSYAQDVTAAATAEPKAEAKTTKALPTDQDKTAAIPADSYLKRGAPIGKAEKASLIKVLGSPEEYAGKTVLVEGIIVRSCKKEGCWAELAPDAAGKSVRIKMKDHSFFIPLESAGAMARVEGKVAIKTLSKAQVDHMIEDDGAKFEDRNADGTVTEVTFEATGVELKRAKS